MEKMGYGSITPGSGPRLDGVSGQKLLDKGGPCRLWKRDCAYAQWQWFKRHKDDALLAVIPGALDHVQVQC